MEREQALAFRAARHGLGGREGRSLAEATACPASELQPGSALLALAARTDELTRERWTAAVDGGELVVAHGLRAALHATAPADAPLFGRALVAEGADDLLDQLGEGAKRTLGERGIDPRDALGEVAAAAEDALRARGALDRVQLHDELRARVRPELLPWCGGCESHHVSPMLWRYALVVVGARRDSERRYVPGEQAETPPAAEAVRRFLRLYGPATRQELRAWGGLGRGQAKALWGEVEAELEPVELDGRRTWLLAADRGDLDAPPELRGLLLLPPRDPYLQHPNQALLVPDAALRKRAFRPVAGPGVVLQDGLVAGLWRARARGRRLEVAVERLGRIDAAALEAEAERVARLRGAEEAALAVAE